jgi:hypothetical protein
MARPFRFAPGLPVALTLRLLRFEIIEPAKPPGGTKKPQPWRWRIVDNGGRVLALSVELDSDCPPAPK